MNGTNVTGPLTVPNSGGWQTWSTIHVPGITLNAGPRVWRVVMDTDGATGGVGNFNWFRIATPPVPVQSTLFGGTAAVVPESTVASAE